MSPIIKIQILLTHLDHPREHQTELIIYIQEFGPSNITQQVYHKAKFHHLKIKSLWDRSEIYFYLTLYSKILQVKTINITILELQNRKNSGSRPIPFTNLTNEKTEAHTINQVKC